MKYALTIIFGILVIMLVGCKGGGGDTGAQSAAEREVVVRTQPIEQADFPVTLELGGSLRGDRQTMIPARVTTTVTKIPVKVGQRVRQGDLLVMLDPGGVQSQYRQAEAVFLNSEKQLQKMRALYESGAVSEMQLDGAQTAYDVAKANFDAARQAVEITAPFDGMVAGLYVRVGDEVAAGRPIVEVANIGSLRLIVNVPTSQVGQLQVGQPVTMASPADSTKIMTGTVYSIADAADQETRNFEVECHFSSPEAGFSPGMYVVAEIKVNTLPGALLVPNEALQYRSGKAQIYVVTGDTVALVMVNPLATADGKTAVEGTLQSGQRVVVVGQKNLTPGARVREAGL
jgi:RND family efflux transporter MFP subunit